MYSNGRKQEHRHSVMRLLSAIGLGLLIACFCIVQHSQAALIGPQTPLVGSTIPKYVDPLPVFGPAGLIPRVTGQNIGVSMEEFQQQVLPSKDPVTGIAFPKTWVWGYNVGGLGANYPGISIEAQRNLPTTVTYTNNLSNGVNPPVLQQYITVDQSIHWADPYGMMAMPGMAGMLMTPFHDPAVPAVPHLHGAEVPSEYDGGPEAWFTPTGLRGGAYRTLNPAGANQAVYQYPNSQPATTLWFHDHALGATRTNVYSGLAAFYLLRDSYDTGTQVNNPSNLPAGPYEIEIAIQDRMFDSNGQWLFPDAGLNTMVHPFWVPEFFGDTIVVNGKTWPYLEVQPRRYRFRILNGSNARFYRLYIPGATIWQIGTDGGLLDAAVPFTGATAKDKLLIAPGERADVIIDFTNLGPLATTKARTKNYLLRNDAPAPFPAGIPGNTAVATAGQIMQFRVLRTAAPINDTSFNPALGLSPRQQPNVSLTAAYNAPVNPLFIDAKRRLTLNEVMLMGGPAEILVNNTKYSGKMLDGKPVAGSRAVVLDPGNPPTVPAKEVYVTETPRVGSTELWEIINLTADAHPIHLHLVQFQLLNRELFRKAPFLSAYTAAFPGWYSNGVLFPMGSFMPGFGPPGDPTVPDASGYLGGNPDMTPFLTGTITLPNANELGWKDTVVMYPGQVTRILVRFAPQELAAGSTMIGTNYFSFDPTTGPGYVWHCHIIDHEDNEMMRPYNVYP